VIDLFAQSPWPGAALWTALFVSDSLLTIACARMYQAGVRERIRFEGSYEITPYHQKDVDALRMFSPRFLAALVVSGVLLLALWHITMADGFLTEAYEAALGAMILTQLTVHVRHVRNYVLFRAVLAGGAITGRIEYAREAMLKLSAVELCTFAVLYAVVSALTRSWFVLGGALACAMLAANHRMMARKHAGASASVSSAGSSA
jgi:hypothetical protein